MTTLRSLTMAKLLGCVLLSLTALTSHATEWIITGVTSGSTTPANVGTWVGPAWGVTGSYSSLQAGDTFIFTTNISSVTANQFFPGANTKSLNFKSDDPSQWRTISNTGFLANTRIFQFYAGNYTYNFDHIIISSGSTNGNGQFGAGIYIMGGVAGTTAITGNVILQNNSVIGSTGQNFAGALNLSALAGSYLAVSATINFINNKAVATGSTTAQGGAVNIAGPALGAEFTGVTLFESNTTTSLNSLQGNGGAYYVAAQNASTSLFSNVAVFKNNYASAAGGAIATNRTHTTTPKLTITDYSYFEGNKAGGVGGAIYWNGDLSISGSSTFINNSAGGVGGAIYLDNNNTPSVSLLLDASGGNITFKNNTHMTATASERNAIAIETSSTQTTVTAITLNSGTTVGDHAIYFFDPISVTNTTAYAKIDVTGSNVVVFDTGTSVVTATTSIQSGVFALTRGAVYGTGTDVGTFTVATGAKLSANGAIRANKITLQDGARLEVNGGGSIALAATTLTTGTNLILSGNGTIDIAHAFDVALIDVGTLISADPTLSATGTNFAQVLTLGSSMQVNLANGGTIAIDLFDTTSDELHIDPTKFALSGSVGYINLVGTGSGQYKVLSSATDLYATTSNLKPLVNGNAPVGHFGASKIYNSGSTELWINFSTINLFTTWTGTAAEGAIWSGTAGSAHNWNNGDLTEPDYTFLNGDSVLFDDTATAKTVTVHASGVTAADMTVNNTVGNDYTFAGSGGIVTNTVTTLGSSVTPTGKLVKQGAGSLNFTNTGTNTFQEGIDVYGGTLGFTTAAQLGDGGHGIHFFDDATLRANAANITLANTLKVDAGKTATIDTGALRLNYTGTLQVAPTGTLAKAGTGALKLTGDFSSNTATTHIKEGVLALDGATTNLGGRIDLDTGATLAGDGIASGDIYAATGAIIHSGALNSGSAVTLTLNNLTLDSSILRFNLFTGGTSDRINLTGTLALNGSNFIDISAFRSGTFNLGNLAGLDVLGTTVTVGGIAQVAGSRQTADVSASGTDLILITGADISRILHWTGTTSGTWTPAHANWTDGDAVNLYANGDRVIFDDTAPAASPHDITIIGSGVTVSDMYVQGTSNYSFSGAGITVDPVSVISGTVITAGTGKLIKQGSGTLAFNNDYNSFHGGIEIGGGAVSFANTDQLYAYGNGITFTDDATLIALGGLSLHDNLTVVAGKTGTLDSGTRNFSITGTLGGSGTLAKIGAGTLQLSGDNNNATNLVVKIAEGSLYLHHFTFTGTIDMAANTLMTGAGTLGGARIASNSTVQLTNDPLNVGSMQFADSSTITGNGTLTGGATLNGMVYANTGSGALINLSGTIRGAGGFHKVGTGTLAYTSVSALGNTGTTQIDEGTINFHGASGTASGSIHQTIVLNSGTLRLNNTTAATAGTDTSAIDWTGITFIQGSSTTSNLSRIIGGSNDIIKVGSGTLGFEMRNGMHVVVDPGANNTTVFTSTNNNFAGVVRIDSGTFQVVDSRALGALGTGTNTTKIVLNGGMMQISSSLSTTRGIEMRTSSGIVSVDTGVNASWGNITKTLNSSTATLTKTGPGTLTISGSSTANGLTIAEGRYVARQTSGAGIGTVSIADHAVFEFATTGTSSSSTVFQGTGTLALTSGTVSFTNNQAEIPHINISGSTAVFQISGNANIVNYAHSTFAVDNGGRLNLASTDQTLGNVILANHATLGFGRSGTNDGGFKKATVAGLSGSGTLAFNTNLATGRADSLTISTAPVGTFDIAIKNYGAVPEIYYAPLVLITAPDAGTATYNAPAAIDVGLFKYAVTTQTDNGNVAVLITGTGAMSNSASLINTMAGALPLSWFAELQNVTQRMGDLHLENRAEKAGLSAWVRGYGQELNFNSKATGTPFDERQLGAEGGFDYKFGGTKYNIYAGAFFGYGQTQRNYDIAGDGSGESIFGGLYETISTKSGWYVDGVLKLNGFKNKFTAVSPTGESMTGDFHNWAIGASLEIGKFCALPYDWFVEPQVQAAFTAIMDSHYTTSSGMQVDLRSGTTSQGRVGFRFGRVYETGKNGLLHIYVKGYGVAQWTTNSQIYVVAPSGQNKRYTPTIKGDRLEGGAGIAWRATERMQYYFDFETADAAYYVKPWGVNFGIRRSW